MTSFQQRKVMSSEGSLQWVTKELLYLFQFVVKVLQRKQGQAYLTLTYRVLDLTSCGLIGVSNASLGGVDRLAILLIRTANW